MSQGTNASTYLSALLLLGVLSGCATVPHESPLGVIKDNKGEPVKSTVTVQPQAVALPKTEEKKVAEIPSKKEAVDLAGSKSSEKEPTYTPADEAFMRNFKMFMYIAAYANGSAYSPNADDPKAQEEMIGAAMKAYLHRLDPHSNYISPEEYKVMNDDKEGQYGGLGIRVGKDEKTGVARIIKVFKDTPAYRAGLKAEDRVISVDGEETGTSEKAVDKMTGTPGTPVWLSVYREGEAKPLKFNLVREIIKVESVETDMVGDIGYLKLATFSEKKVHEKVEEGIRRLQKENENIKGYVIDLRDNLGGLLKEAKEVSDLFLDKGMVVTLKNREGRIVDSYEAKRGDITEGKPITVLINDLSASASEIFAGALKGNRRALIVGNTSYGKGSAQDIFPLSRIFNDPTMGGALQITTKLFFVPNGHGGLMSNQGVGIEPDVVYQKPKDVEQSNFLAVRKEAVLDGMIANPDGKKTETSTTKSFCTAAVGADLEGKDLQKPLIDVEGKPDYVLLCAVNALDEDSDLKNLTSITPAVPNVPPTAMNLTQ